MRQRVGAPVKLAVAQLLLLEDDRNRIRASPHLRREQLRQGRSGKRMAGRVPLPQDGRALLRAQYLQLPQRTLRAPPPRSTTAGTVAHGQQDRMQHELRIRIEVDRSGALSERS